MALLQFADRSFDADLVAFDKDGTLIDIEFMWGRLAKGWVEYLTVVAGDKQLESELYISLGYDPEEQRMKPLSPLATATRAQLQAIAAVTLYRYGIPWMESDELARRSFETGTHLPLAELIRPTGDVIGLLERLQDSGVRVAVVTTDHRAETLMALSIMGVAHLIDYIVCGDDGLQNKPAPDMMQATCLKLGVDLNRAAVVGDTMADLMMAERAGTGLKVAVLTGAGEVTLLGQLADVVMQSIDDIVVQQPA